jgi:hypothetical protein
MSQTLSQNTSQNQKVDLVELLIRTYTCKEDTLRYKLNKVNKLLEQVNREYQTAKRALDNIERIMSRYVFYYFPRTYIKLVESLRDLEDAYKDNVEKLIHYEIPYDPDVEKFEKAFGVKFKHGDERLLGVILLEKKGNVRPLAIWTNYKEVGYLEGEKSEQKE